MKEIIEEVSRESEEEDTQENELKVNYNIEIKIKKEVEDKIQWFTNNYEEEIGAFLIGDIKKEVITIDGMLFYHQEVSMGSTEVEPKDLVKLRKEYGNECLRIIGHFHSHNTMGVFWSGTDKEFMESYSKTRDITLFLVASKKDRHKIKLVIRKPFEISLDNLDYEIIWDDKKFEDDLKKVIKEKVTERTYVNQNTSIDNYDDYNDYGNSQTNFVKYNTETQKYINKKANESIRYNAETGYIYVKNLDRNQADSLLIDTKKNSPQIRKTGNFTTTGAINYEVIYKTREKQKAIELIRDIKFYLQEIYEGELEETNYGY